MTRSSWLPYLCGAGAIACWASLAVAIGESLRVARPETVLFWGLLVAGISLTLWERIRWEWNRRERQRWEALGNGRGPSAWLEWPGWRGVLHGVYGIWGYHTLLVLAFANAPQVEANILNYTWTLWIVVLGAMLPGHRLTTRIVAAGALGFAGVALVIGGEGLLAGRALPSLSLHGVGFALALAASLVWSSFTVFMRLMVTPGRGRMAVFCLLSAAAALGFALAQGAPLALPWSQATVVIYLGLAPLGLSFVLWEYAAQHAQMQVLGLMSFFTPLLSTLMLTLVSGAPVGASLYGGLALIMAGGWLGKAGLGKTESEQEGAGRE